MTGLVAQTNSQVNKKTTCMQKNIWYQKKSRLCKKTLAQLKHMWY